MASSVDWKRLTRTLAELHAEHGTALVKWQDWDGLVSVNAASDEDLFECEGRRIPVKQLRTHLFDLRYERKTRKDRLVLWSVYDDEANKTYVGLGLQVKPKLLDRANVRVLEVINGR